MPNQAQTYTMGHEVWTTWEDFIEYYGHYLTEFDEEEATNGWTEEVILRLEEIKNAPINLNTTDRGSLLELPFLQTSQVDAILQYRAKHRLFRSLGELQFVKELSFDTRSFLSLFVYAGDTISRPTTWTQRLFSGKHEVSTRADFPLYIRAGYNNTPQEEESKTSNDFYVGNGIAHILRYRYRWQQDVAYGITLEKDAGEPFATNGNYPYDFTSFYLYLRSPQKRYAVWFGDFNVYWAQGLVMGGSYFSGRIQSIENTLRAGKEIKPHTSADEYNFLRGIATSIRLRKQWTLSAFASYRKLDAHISENVVTSFKTDGLHRTPAEIQKRHCVGNSTNGLRLLYQRKQWHVGLGAMYTHYSRKIWPSPRIYNTYYLKGKDAFATELDYAWHSAKWTILGETAIDQKGHPATTNTIKYAPSQRASFTLQQRSISPRFVSPFGNILQAGSRTSNEHGLLLGTYLQPLDRLSLTAYVDIFRMPQPTYRAYQASQGMETYLQARWKSNKQHQIVLRYRFKTKQQNITGYAPLLEYYGTHTARIASTYTTENWNLHLSADACIATQQTKAPSFGWMFSARSTQQWNSKLSTAFFAATFFTDDYSSRLYAYEPRLQYSAGFPTFAYHGLRFVSVINWKPIRLFSIGLRYGMLHYFNRDNIGSDTQLIDSPSKNDISLQLKLTL